MKKISVIMVAILLTLCGVRTMASFLSLTSMGSGDRVTMSTLSVKAGDAFSLPISLENSNTDYVAFQMDIQVPQGVKPVFDEDGFIVIDKTSRLNSAHDFSATFDAESNTIKLLCSSMRNVKIKETSGELFFINLQADATMISGDYQISCKNIMFSTSSAAEGGAQTYYMPDVSDVISVAGSAPVVADIDVAQALDIISKLEEGGVTEDYYKVHGVITSISDISVNYGNTTFNMSAPDGRELTVYRAYGLNGEKVTDENLIQVGDEVVVYGKLQNYKGTPEICQGGYLVSITKADHIVVPPVSADAGSTFSLPVCLENSNTDYVAFQMDIQVPQGVTPIVDEEGYVIIDKASRLYKSHDVSGTFDARSNTIKLLGSSMSNAKIKETSGELFFINLQADATMISGDYQIACKNIMFSTSSTAEGGAQSYTMPDAFSTLSVKADENIVWTIAGSSEIFGSYWEADDPSNDMTEVEDGIFVLYKNNVSLKSGILYEFKVVGNHSWDINYGADGLAGGPNVGFTVDKNGKYNLQFFFYRNKNNWLEYNVEFVSEEVRVNMEINVEQPGTLQELIANEGYTLQEVIGLTVSGSLNYDDMNAIKSMYNLEKIDLGEADVTEIPYETFYYRSNLRSVVLPKNLQTIGSNAFYGCYSLTEITLPESLQSIGYWAFGNCENLKSITCKTFLPIVLYDYIMSEWNANQCTLYVPAIAVEAYKNAYFWQYFQIQGTDYMPENIFVGSNLTIDWPSNLDADYKPNVSIGLGNNSGAYGALTMNGESIMSINSFGMVWAPNNYYRHYNSETGSYEWYRYSNASLIANTPMRADNVLVELRTNTFQWDFISFPFDVKVSDITNLTQSNAPLVIRRYDGKNRADGKMGETWVDMDAESTLEAGKGYIWQSADGDQEYSYNYFIVPALNNSNKNNIFKSNDVTVELNEYISEFSQSRSWNLIGNPYPAFYDIRGMQTTAPITIWNGYNWVYEAYTPGDDNYILNPGQAFFIQRPVDQESIVFKKEYRQNDLNVREEMPENISRRAAANSERYVFNLLLSGSEENLGDRTRIVFDATAKMDYEAGRDASKFMSPEASAAQLFTTVGGLRYAINNRPLSDGIVELGLSIGTAGSYTIALNTKVEGEVYLIDRETGSEIRLDGTEGYTFQATKGVIEGRFAVRFGNGDVTGIKGVAGNGKDAGNWYNLNGQRVNAPAKGIFIQDGKKTVVK